MLRFLCVNYLNRLVSRHRCLNGYSQLDIYEVLQLHP